MFSMWHSHSYSLNTCRDAHLYVCPCLYNSLIARCCSVTDKLNFVFIAPPHINVYRIHQVYRCFFILIRLSMAILPLAENRPNEVHDITSATPHLIASKMKSSMVINTISVLHSGIRLLSQFWQNAVPMVEQFRHLFMVSMTNLF